jgi:hypothetical protein
MVDEGARVRLAYNSIRRFIRHCHDSTWSAGRRGRNQVCLMIDEESMWSIVGHPTPGDLECLTVSQPRVPRAYAVVVDRHYDLTETTLEPGVEPGEEIDLGPDTMNVAISDVLSAFYTNLLCDLHLEEMVPHGKSGIWSAYGMMTSYKDDQEDIFHGASQLEPQRLAMASTTTPINKPGGGTAQETPQILGPVAATTRKSSKMANQTDAQGNAASGSKADSDTENQGAYEPCFTRAWLKPAVFFIRHRLQRTMLSREQLVQEEDMPAVSDKVKWLEDHHIDADIVRRTKINKVL